MSAAYASPTLTGERWDRARQTLRDAKREIQARLGLG